MKGKRYQWTADMDNTLATLYTSGISLEDIFAEMGIDRKLILTRINYLKLKRPALKKFKGIECQKEQAIYTYAINNPGCDVADIEKATGVNKVQIRATLKKHPVIGVKDRGLEQAALAYQAPARETVGIVGRLGYA